MVRGCREEPRLLQLWVEASCSRKTARGIPHGVTPKHAVSPSYAKPCCVAPLPIADPVAERAKFVLRRDGYAKPALEFDAELFPAESETKVFVRKRLEKPAGPWQHLGVDVGSVGYSKAAFEGLVLSRL